MDNIIFSLTRIPDAITDKVIYRANVQTNGTIGRDELAALMASLSIAASAAEIRMDTLSSGSVGKSCHYIDVLLTGLLKRYAGLKISTKMPCRKKCHVL